MSTQKKITRKELRQPDRVQETLYGFVNYVFQHKRPFVSGAVAMIVAILGIWGGFQYHQAQQVKKSVQYAEVQKQVEEASVSGKGKLDQGIKALQGFILENPDHYLSVVAWLRLGNLFAEQREWAKAEDAFQEVIAHGEAPSFTKNLARLSLATIYENQSKFVDARTMITSLDSGLWDDFRWNMLARIALANGNKEEAKIQLNELIKSGSEPELKQNAELLLMTIN
ncbi:tetratricopeptide repeat protein [Deltaproteobacteria bacterium TL4]